MQSPYLMGIPHALGTERPLADTARFGLLPAGTPTTKGAPLFPRIDPAADEAS